MNTFSFTSNPQKSCKGLALCLFIFLSTSSVTVLLCFMYYYEVFRCFKSKVVLKSLPGQSFQRTAGPSGQLQVSNSIGEKNTEPTQNTN